MNTKKTGFLKIKYLNDVETNKHQKIKRKAKIQNKSLQFFKN